MLCICFFGCFLVGAPPGPSLSLVLALIASLWCTLHPVRKAGSFTEAVPKTGPPLNRHLLVCYLPNLLQWEFFRSTFCSPVYQLLTVISRLALQHVFIYFLKVRGAPKNSFLFFSLQILEDKK